MIPPNLGVPPRTYEQSYFSLLRRTLDLFFASLVAVRPWTVSKLSISIDTLPTEADLASLRSGDVYRDSTADNVLKVKP